MRNYHKDIPDHTRERAVSLYVDNKLSLKGVADALGITVSIVRKIIQNAGVMRPHMSEARNAPHGLADNIPTETLSYVAGVYDTKGIIDTLAGSSVRYGVTIQLRESVAAYIKSLLVIGAVHKGPRGTFLYRISKQSDVEAFCTSIAPYSQNKRHLLYVAERINDVRAEQENKAGIPTG